jgi:hypothetical protein
MLHKSQSILSLIYLVLLLVCVCVLPDVVAIAVVVFIVRIPHVLHIISSSYSTESYCHTLCIVYCILYRVMISGNNMENKKWYQLA